MTPCYVSGKGMHASEPTWSFKVSVIEFLETSGLGFDTRFRYYRSRFADMDMLSLARMVCDPIEYYDPDWPAFLSSRSGENEDELVVEYMLRLDKQFQVQAQLAIYCFDEAGFGSGVNAMRFIQRGVPILGFYHHDAKEKGVNISNILQLRYEFPELVTLHAYYNTEEILAAVKRRLSAE